MAHHRPGSFRLAYYAQVRKEFDPRCTWTPMHGALLNGLAVALLRTKGSAAALDHIREQIKSHQVNPEFPALLAVFLMNDH